MASVIVFPNVATHRKLPHLQPKDTHKDKTPAAGGDAAHPSQDALHSGLQHLSIQDSKQQQPPQLAQGQQRAMIQDASTSTASQQQQLPRLIEPDTKHTLTVDTQPPASSLSYQHKDKALVQSAASTPSDSSYSSRQPSSSINDSPYSALPPSGLPTGNSSSSSNSIASLKQLQHPHHPSAELLKTAIYDAFGCLYHPMQHTHPSSKSSLTAAAALRSGEVTPLLGLSPRASPRLLPQGTSGPITPLELSDENGASIHAGGYFGVTPTPTSTTTTTTTTTTTANASLSSQANTAAAVSAGGKQGAAANGGGGGASGTLGAGASSGGHHQEGHHSQHHHHYHHHQHRPHTSSHLHTASSLSSDEDDDETKYTLNATATSQTANDGGRCSRPRSAASSRRSSTMMTPMNAVEHPVLNTLQTMTHHHALPGYLDHDLGHDRIPLPPLPAPVTVAPLPSMPSPSSYTTTTTTIKGANQHTQAESSESTIATTTTVTTAAMTTTTTTPPTSGRNPSHATSQQPPPPPVFAMDRGGPIPQGFSDQKLV
ncbi:hypothetical protein DFQ27_003350 [Actinomortierella ambigua]|uniref:Uncharacterized protein n=1 Tax=Actinomortierella ambigua TaxID=1343610 RepID=A0A9P6U5Y7_9FUNG|nr:hypothetical protein DFQ27_003350 [Actinomortierella ambigua]